MTSVLQVRDLSLSISGKPVLRSLSFDLSAGQTLGIVGESGSGKSLTALALMRLLPAGSKLSGSIRFCGRELTTLSEASMCALRGREMSMAFQEPMAALNPLQTIGSQVAEVFVQHQALGKTAALAKAAGILERVGLPPRQFPLSRYPFELSGGQRQRVVIAIAIALRPRLLIADEPTTALDVSTEAKVIDLLQALCAEEEIALIFVSHDLATVVRLADRLAVMRHGEIVESGATLELIDNSSHPYTSMLRNATAMSRRGQTRSKSSVEVADEPVTRALLQVRNVCRDYPLPRSSLLKRREIFRAVDDVSFDLRAGESLGLVGESGSGKSTLVRAVLGLEPLSAGVIDIDGTRFWPARQKVQRPLRKHIQAVFQDPYSSFDPRQRIATIVAEPLHLLHQTLSHAETDKRIGDCLESVGLSSSDRNKYPHQFSGGQRQRIAIARALAVSPSIVVLDEATSALDVALRADILSLLADLSQRFGISYLFVSHDLDVVRAVTDRILIMKSGKIIEQGNTKRIFDAPSQPYTKMLIAAKPGLEQEIRRRKEAGETHV